MSEYDQTFDPKAVKGLCDLISWSIDFALYLDAQLVYTGFSHIICEYDQPFDQKVIIGH